MTPQPQKLNRMEPLHVPFQCLFEKPGSCYCCSRAYRPTHFYISHFSFSRSLSSRATYHVKDGSR